MIHLFHWTRRCLLAAVLAGFAVSLLAQPQTPPRPFEPSVGQAGKDVIWVPTSHELVNKMLDIANVTASDYVIDLGSGDGRLVIAAAKRGAKALGIEYNPDMVELSKASAAKEGVSDKAQFMKADIFESDFSKATVITMFLLPDINLRLRPKLLDLKPGTRIVSNTFTMGEWASDESAPADAGGADDEEGYSYSYRTALLWIVPAKVGGTWQMGQGELVLSQNYQILSGSVTMDSKRIDIADAKLRGDQIHFRAGETEYTGTVNGSRIEGHAVNNGRSSPWTATLRSSE